MSWEVSIMSEITVRWCSKCTHNDCARSVMAIWKFQWSITENSFVCWCNARPLREKSLKHITQISAIPFRKYRIFVDRKTFIMKISKANESKENEKKRNKKKLNNTQKSIAIHKNNLIFYHIFNLFHHYPLSTIKWLQVNIWVAKYEHDQITNGAKQKTADSTTSTTRMGREKQKKLPREKNRENIMRMRLQSKKQRTERNK